MSEQSSPDDTMSADFENAIDLSVDPPSAPPSASISNDSGSRLCGFLRNFFSRKPKAPEGEDQIQLPKNQQSGDSKVIPRLQPGEDEDGTTTPPQQPGKDDDSVATPPQGTDAEPESSSHQHPGQSSATVPSGMKSQSGSSSTRKRAHKGEGDAPSKKKQQRANENSNQSQQVPHPTRVRESNSVRRMLISQQDTEYQQSLAADQMKEQKKREAAEQLERLMKLKAAAASKVPAEPEMDEEGVFMLVVRFPTGNIVRRRFRPSDTILILQQFVFSVNECPLDYDIVSPPDQVILLSRGLSHPNDLTLADFHLTRSQVLHVREALAADEVAAGLTTMMDTLHTAQ